jgi:hypothetical protein
MTKNAIAMFLLAALLGGVCFAQDAAAPTLSDVQKLRLLTTVQRVEIAQLRAQAAQRELADLLKSFQVQGYTLDLDTLTYAPAKVVPPAK